MTRYRLFRGKLREHAQGEWVRAEDMAAMQAALAKAQRLLLVCEFDAEEDLADNVLRSLVGEVAYRMVYQVSKEWIVEQESIR